MIPQGGTNNRERYRLSHSCPGPGNKDFPSTQRAQRTERTDVAEKRDRDLVESRSL